MAKCQKCKKKILSKKNKKFCSKICKKKYLKSKRVRRKCHRCGNIVSKAPSYIVSKKVFCCRECAMFYNKAFLKSTGNKNTKPERKFKKILRENKIRFIPQYCIALDKWKNKYYDFFLIDYNTLIEIDGVYWHAKNVKDKDLDKIQKKSKENDSVKNKLARKNKLRLIRIWEDEIDEFDIRSLR